MNKTISVSKTDAHFSGQIIDTNIIVKVRKVIDKKFPDTSEEDKSYIFNLIMSRPVYNGFKWDQTSGDLKLLFHGDEKNKIYTELGISESEYLKVTYNIGLQNRMSGIAFYPSQEFDYSAKDYFDEEFKAAKDAIGKDLTKEEFYKIWDSCRTRFYGKVDFAHMSATISTLQNPNILRISNGMGVITDKDNPHKFINELAGWRGDVTNQAFAKPSLGNDDYKADLDADNIVNLYNNSSKDYLTVVNTYYNDIESGALNRADEFIKNNKLDYIQNEILQASSYISETTSSFDPYGYPVVEFITPNMDELKNLNTVGYNFIKSFENHENNLVDYINN